MMVFLKFFNLILLPLLHIVTGILCLLVHFKEVAMLDTMTKLRFKAIYTGVALPLLLILVQHWVVAKVFVNGSSVNYVLEHTNVKI